MKDQSLIQLKVVVKSIFITLNGKKTFTEEIFANVGHKEIWFKFFLEENFKFHGMIFAIGEFWFISWNLFSRIKGNFAKISLARYWIAPCHNSLRTINFLNYKSQFRNLFLDFDIQNSKKKGILQTFTGCNWILRYIYT